ncbi:hypothetical protein BNJ_00320 [Kaumoebavirus]|uniref:hypothetical protein n=1 Tax=Kaumoebavirus TaxID=1859492 RepID=UPI0009C30FB6|nr:hypothetical protein BNJ_00320 [Kaumoebavirus]ARA72142.1 hypothetical protein BNJ_00320 [Kaumoebavirus]
MSCELDAITEVISEKFPDINHYDDEVKITLDETGQEITQLIGPARIFNKEDKTVGVLIYTKYPADSDTPLILFQRPLSDQRYASAHAFRLTGDYQKRYLEKFSQGM